MTFDLSDSAVLIIGAGPAGLSVATELGFHGIPAEVMAAPVGAAESLNEGTVAGLPYRGLTERAHGLGGNGRTWRGQFMRYHAIDFERRPWVRDSGWIRRISEEAYATVEAWFGVADTSYEGEDLVKAGLRLPAFDEDKLACRASVFIPTVDVTATFDRLPARSRYRVREAVAVRVEPAARGWLVHGRDPAIGSVTIRARTVVLAGGALENARLLLSSPIVLGRMARRAHNVGRFLSDHPGGVVGNFRSWNDAMHRLQVHRRGSIRYFPKFHLAESAQRDASTLNATCHPVFDYASGGITQSMQTASSPRRVVLTALRRPIQTGRLAAARRAGATTHERPQGVSLHVHMEQAPQNESAVSVDESRLDRWGRPHLVVDWRLGALEAHTARTLAGLAKTEFARAGLGDLQLDTRLHTSEWAHLMNDNLHPSGTTRMAGNDSGVVDASFGVHGNPGLYVAGSSVFPTGSYVNPTLTIMAQSVDLARDLVRQLT